MSDPSATPTPSALNRDEATRLAQSEETEPRLLEELPAKFPGDEELWKLLVANPVTPLPAMIYMAERAPASVAAQLLEDRVFLFHNPAVGQALLKNPILTEPDRRRVQWILHETTKEERERKKTLFQLIREMNTGQKLALAKKGNKDARMILIKDPNDMIALEVVNSPRISEDEIATIVQMRDISDKVLRAIANIRRFRANKQIVTGLLHNPKTPVGVSLGLGLPNLTDRELKFLAGDRNIPAAVSRAAKQVMERRAKGPAPKRE
ncbi:MAG: hypothetical protein L0Y78_00395 [candidate division NC10 bacterium]|nr:hypothetical protein [candidate division NC10 bacterium]